VTGYCGNFVSNGHTLPLTLERAKPETAAALDPAIEAQKDYSHTSPNDLPRGTGRDVGCQTIRRKTPIWP